jgi:hypothetical protein
VRANQRVVDAADRLQVFVALAVGDDDRFFRSETRERALVKAPHDRVGDEEAPRRYARRIQQFLQPSRQSGLDVDAVASAAAADLEKHG